MLSSKGDAKNEARFATRIDVLNERIDTLAATIATTASSMAKHDGELAALRKELNARDARIAGLLANAGSTGAAEDELRALQQTVAALAADKQSRGGSKQLDELTAKVGLLAQRLDTLAGTVSTTAAGLAGREGELALIRKRLESGPVSSGGPATTDPALQRRVEELVAAASSAQERLARQAEELDALKQAVARRETEPQPHSDELRTMLATLRERVEALAGLRVGVSEEQLDDRLKAIDKTVGDLDHRVEALAGKLESATERVADKEHELAALHRHFMESSTRIEAVVEDLREALGALSEIEPGLLAQLATRLDATSAGLVAVGKRVDRLEGAHPDELVARLAERVDGIDERIASLSQEIGRAKTLWPVALRSLEARLDDATAPRPAEEEPVAAPSSGSTSPGDGETDELLAELRDSLQAMESVAAEMERVGDGVPAASGDVAPAEVVATDPAPVHEVVAGGARIVPLRSGEP